jgi:uncharacterized protein (TIGR02594 family)
MTNSATIYAAAKRYLGTAETSGSRSTSLIKLWITKAAGWLDPDDSVTAWCGCFRGAIGYETGTGVPSSHYRAAAWASWGEAVPLDKPELWQQGDTIVMSRPGGNHVTLLDRVVGTRAFCLGGNQGDAVSVAPFALSKITAVRR